MGDKSARRLAKLEESRSPIELQDAMPEAARKALLNQFITVEQLTDLSEPAQIGTMFAAARRSLQLFMSCGHYFDAALVEPFEMVLAEKVSLLENVYYHQRLLKMLSAYQEALDEEKQPLLDAIMERTIKRAGKAGKELTKFLSSKGYARFLKDYSKFLMKDGKGTLEPDALSEPYEVRHLLPVILHEHLASVRAYDAVMTESDEIVDSEILNELYHQVIALLDMLSAFESILGTSIADFVTGLTEMADVLDLHHFTDFALATLTPSNKMEADSAALLGEVRASLEATWIDASVNLPALWSNFSARTSQRKFSDSLLVLR